MKPLVQTPIPPKKKKINWEMVARDSKLEDSLEKLT
jgi:hypothetical protein